MPENPKNAPACSSARPPRPTEGKFSAVKAQDAAPAGIPSSDYATGYKPRRRPTNSAWTTVVSSKATWNEPTESERRNLLDLEHRTVDGVYRYTVEGVVADCEETSVSNGYVSRLCLMFPHVVNADGSLTLIDSHIWLATFVGNTIIRPDRIEPHNSTPDRLFTVRLGDTLRVDAGLRAYTDKYGRHRFGLADWTPLDSRLRYLQLRSDGTSTERVVSERLCGREFDVCWLERDGRPGFRSVVLEGLESRVRKCWDSYDWKGRTFLSDGDGFPSVCLEQYVAVDLCEGRAHVVSR